MHTFFFFTCNAGPTQGEISVSTTTVPQSGAAGSGVASSTWR